MIDVYFEKVKNYENLDLPLPTRKTAYSAGYDFMVAEDIVVPSYLKLMEKFKTEVGPIDNPITLCTIAQLNKDIEEGWNDSTIYDGHEAMKKLINKYE